MQVLGLDSTRNDRFATIDVKSDSQGLKQFAIAIDSFGTNLASGDCRPPCRNAETTAQLLKMNNVHGYFLLFHEG
jgi:hypothetical protein